MAKEVGDITETEEGKGKAFKGSGIEGKKALKQANRDMEDLEAGVRGNDGIICGAVVSRRKKIQARIDAANKQIDSSK